MHFCACFNKNSITGGSQFLLVSESVLMKFSTQQCKSFLSRHKVISGSQQTEMVSLIGFRISNAVIGYLKQKGQSDLLTGYDWEFRLVVNDASVNA
jgi:hypothetical protein